MKKLVPFLFLSLAILVVYSPAKAQTITKEKMVWLTPKWESERFDDGYTPVPEKPGPGVEINEEAVREHLIEDAGYFEPTPEWNKIRSWDRTWS